MGVLGVVLVHKILSYKFLSTTKVTASVNSERRTQFVSCLEMLVKEREWDYGGERGCGDHFTKITGQPNTSIFTAASTLGIFHPSLSVFFFFHYIHILESTNRTSVVYAR